MNVKARSLIVGMLFLLGVAYVGHSISNSDAEANYEDSKGAPVKSEVAFKAPQLASSQRPLTVTEVTLSQNNMVLFRSDYNMVACAKAQRELIQKSRNLPAGQPIYLVLDTPGGSIDAGNQLIATAQNLGRPVHTITIFAASMGFNTAMQLGKRYILPTGTLMAHRARVGGVGGQVPGEAITMMANIVRMVAKFEEKNAKRLGINLDTYTQLVRDEYWVEGEDAVRQNAADELASLKCDDTLQGTHQETANTAFGPVTLEWDNCPAVTAPVGFSFQGSNEDQASVSRILYDYTTFRRNLVRAVN